MKDLSHVQLKPVIAQCSVMSTDADSRRKRKMAEISQALNRTPVDVAALRRMAISEGGLLSDELRRQVWPRLLNVSVEHIPEQLGKSDPNQRSLSAEYIAFYVVSYNKVSFSSL